MVCTRLKRRFVREREALISRDGLVAYCTRVKRVGGVH